MQLNKYFSGDEVYGDDFDTEKILQWYNDEVDGFYQRLMPLLSEYIGNVWQSVVHVATMYSQYRVKLKSLLLWSQHKSGGGIYRQYAGRFH